MPKYPFITNGSGLHIKRLPAYWAMRNGTRCCVAVGFFERYHLVFTSYVHLN
jgi:hypothetical protein